MTFPSPIGGIPYASDFAPALVFAIAYGCLLPLVAYRFLDKKSRTTVLIGNSTFAIERVVAFAFRAMQARNENRRFSEGIASYLQADLTLGYIGIAADLNKLLRTLLVISTYGYDAYVQSTEAESRYRYWLSSAKVEASASGERDFPSRPPEGTPDNPKFRSSIRLGSNLLGLVYLVALILGLITTIGFKGAIGDQAQADRDMKLRYASTGLALLCTLCMFAAILWAYVRLPRVNKRGCLILSVLSLWVCVIAIYRLTVMYNTTDSLQSTAPGSLNAPGEKAAFYVFHLLPEWVCTLVVFVFNTRRIFSTGLLGDWRSKDETPEEVAKREKKEMAHREKLKIRNSS